MRFRIVLAVSLMVLAVCVIVYEIVYLKNTSDIFSDQLNNIIEHLTNEDYQNAVLLFESFQKDFFESENMLSVFIHDKAVDEIRNIIYNTNLFLKKQNEYFETEDVLRNLENIKVKIRDIYESMIPDIRNLM
ncbi:MAG: DUF4363 family protein [Ruminococcaceae bacterium]|nr:DUF4363 family protein [Oscillospiraceae bacterium]